jgi:aryl-alcohol dehydrogenase-like predicted oxidoreductase
MSLLPRALGQTSGLTARPLAFGGMNFCWAYGPGLSEAETERLLLGALDAGIDHIDTAAVYGFGESETRIGRLLNARGHRRRFVLASKCGLGGVRGPEGLRRVIDGRPATIRQQCEESLQRLQTDVIDLYTLHRWDKQVPIEDSIGAMADLLRQGKVRALGLSEVSAATLRRAHAVHPIATVQNEFSLWSRNVELGVLQACHELGVGLVAFSAMARGWLASTAPDPAQFDAKDIRRSMPRFTPAGMAANAQLHAEFMAWVAAHGLTPAQAALGWLLARGDHVHVLPGTTRLAHLHDNLSARPLAPALVQALDEMFQPQRVAGPRYGAQASTEVDTESF